MASHLGDCIGDAPLPNRPLSNGPSMIERKSHVIYGAIALCIMVASWIVALKMPAGAQITCDVVISRAKGLTIEEAVKRAKELGLSEKEIEQVKACLKASRK
jgi:hypothetical protein